MAQDLTFITKIYGKLVLCYVAHVLIATRTFRDHIDKLDEVFDCIKRTGWKCNSSKCEILRVSIKYLGRVVDTHWMRSDLDAELRTPS